MHNAEPIFKTIFGSQWESLPPVFHKRYANRPFNNDIHTVQGIMDIDFSRGMACFMPFFRLFNILVPYQGKDIPVTVNFCSKPDSSELFINRQFNFPGKAPYEFYSSVKATQLNEAIEMMGFGLGWRMRYFYDGKKVVMQHKGYVWQILGFNIPLPLEIFIGKSYAEEEMIDDNTYRITMTITHALFGRMYNYTGVFSFKS